MVKAHDILYNLMTKYVQIFVKKIDHFFSCFERYYNACSFVIGNNDNLHI